MTQKTANILIVEDDLATIDIMAYHLEDKYDICVALSILQALEILSKQDQPDLILMDVILPDGSGHDLCRELKSGADTKDIPIIFVTGLTTDDEFTLGFDLGAVDYITKPVNSSILKARVQNAISSLRKSEELLKLAKTDPLTKIANRRHYKEAFNAEWQRSVRTKDPISIAVLDIDNFKAYNDNLGHGKGDEVLVQFSQILNDCCHRTSDLPARIGGEEFVLLLPDTDLSGAENVLKKAQQLLKQANILHPYSEVSTQVTFSCGVVTSTIAEFYDPDEMFELADSVMYEAKSIGKNRVIYRQLTSKKNEAC